MSFQLAHPDGTHVPRIVTKPLAASQTFLEGALLLEDSNGAYAECGADPAAIAAVAPNGGGADTSGFNILGQKSFPPGFLDGISVRNVIFSAKYVGTLPAADGGSYGVVKDSDGYWKVDFSETSATRVVLVGRRTTSPENIARVLVRFLDANVQTI